MNAIERKLLEINQRLTKFKVLKDDETIIDNLALFVPMGITDTNSYLNEIYAIPVYTYKYKQLKQLNVNFNYLIFFLKQYEKIEFGLMYKNEKLSLAISLYDVLAHTYIRLVFKNKNKKGYLDKPEILLTEPLPDFDNFDFLVRDDRAIAYQTKEGWLVINKNNVKHLKVGDTVTMPNGQHIELKSKQIIRDIVSEITDV